MSVAQIILGAVVIVLAVVIMVIIMIQQGKNDGLGAMAGGSSADAESYFNKNQNRSRDAILNRVTIIVAVLLVAAIVALSVIG